MDLSDGNEHDTLQLVGFSAAAHLDFISVSGTTQTYRIVDGDYVSQGLLIQVANGSGRLGILDYHFG
ncbi:hypothetical protein [Dankookia sp. P2]|uniref:hypothetical protein n=1 Tax=Dankookia sp. P2 TaxID=3423955 RepID=UPI003D665BD8